MDRDHFATFALDRAPWLDADALRERFHRLSAERHPDAASGSTADFTELNAAWQTLRDPAARLRHFLELEHPGVLDQNAQPPAGLADLFMDIGSLQQAVQQFRTRQNAATSPLTHALLEPARIALQTRAAALATQLAERHAAAIRAIHGATPDQLATTLTALIFLGKWDNQLHQNALNLQES